MLLQLMALNDLRLSQRDVVEHTKLFGRRVSVVFKKGPS